ncbi:MAG: DUF1559 domain-containing protein, partial [Planctomycetia bacterium]|nr:DUF1559 domain-containing protein [Planctomycetia bacterium]
DEFSPPMYGHFSGRGWGNATFPVRSDHSAGVNASMLDGSVRFISDTVNLTAWRAASTINGKETTTEL